MSSYARAQQPPASATVRPSAVGGQRPGSESSVGLGRVIDPQDFSAKIYTDQSGRTYRKKPGRRKKLTAAQAARLYELQCQVRAADKAIAELLTAAGVLEKGARCRIARQNWRDRGQIDVLHPARKVRP